MLDGAARVGELVEEAARQEMPAIAMTDHGNVFGAFEFYKQANKVGIKPIIGIEAYVAPESRFNKSRVKWADGGDDDVSGGGAYTHMTLLAENNEGLGNLFRLSSLASLEGFYYKPRMDRELLSKYADGIIATLVAQVAKSKLDCAWVLTEKRSAPQVITAIFLVLGISF
jgi:DNA polymerase-3 subunit alpha